ncbi:MAG: bifunctional riboflavin kinase/FAD synthetase [Bdellovibrionales bacterium]|nr:bifunctional riboflavin kinase/FAD synthetase [Bdellovibrionales bacterium]
MKSLVTIGNFDGVHRGHRALIESLNDHKRHLISSESVRTVVVTFDPHPAEVLTGRIVPRLSTAAERTALIQNLGIDEVRVIPFTKEFAATSAHDFFEGLLVKDLNAGFVAVGHDFNFGHNREGTPGQMIDWCRKAGIAAQFVTPVEADGAPISSSRIRKLISEGLMIPASRLLGRDYSLSGEVIHGDKRGRQLGFPTANLMPVSEGHGAHCIPARGVYLSASTIEGKTFASITNVGVKPTVSNTGVLLVETHLLDFSGDLYGKQLTVEFSDRLRGEQKFPNLAALTEQIQKDIHTARSRLTRL